MSRQWQWTHQGFDSVSVPIRMSSLVGGRWRNVWRIIQMGHTHPQCMLLASLCSPPDCNNTRRPPVGQPVWTGLPQLPRPTLVVEMKGWASRGWEALEPQGCLVGGLRIDSLSRKDWVARSSGSFVFSRSPSLLPRRLMFWTCT